MAWGIIPTTLHVTGGKKSGKAEKPPASAEPLSELGKEFYNVQITDLENRLVRSVEWRPILPFVQRVSWNMPLVDLTYDMMCWYRYQHRCDELEVANGQFQDKYNQLETDKREIVAFLKKNLEQRGTSCPYCQLQLCRIVVALRLICFTVNIFKLCHVNERAHHGTCLCYTS